MPLANLDMSLDTYFTLVQRVNQLVQVTNEEQTKGFYSNGNVAVNGSFTANGNLRVNEANVAANLVVYKSATIRASDGQVVALNVASGLVKGDGGLLSNIRSANLTTNNFSVQSNNSTVVVGGSAELGKTLFLSVRTSTDLADNAAGNVASTQLANVLDLHIKTVHGVQNTIVSTDLPSKQSVNTNLHQLANVGPMSNGDILVFANNRLERLPLGVANQTLIVQNNRLEFSNALTTTIVETFTESGFWNKPANFKEAIIYVIGGGGGGAAGYINQIGQGYAGAGGGGGGVGIYYANNASLASNVTVTIGAGGAGGNAFVITSLALGGTGVILGSLRQNPATGPGSAGGTTSFGSLTAPGGGGGGASGIPGTAGDNIYKTSKVPHFASGHGGTNATAPSYDSASMPIGSAWGSVTGNSMIYPIVVTGGGSSENWGATSNSVPDIGYTRVYYGSYIAVSYYGGPGDSVTNSPSGTGGVLSNGNDGVAVPFENIYISLGGTSGYPAWRSKGANGGNGVYGSGGGAGTGPHGNATNSQLNTWSTIETGHGGYGGNGYVVVISTIGRE